MSKLRGGICDTRCQLFQKECVRKEERLKTMWFIKNQQRLYDNLGKEKFSEQIKTLQQQQQKKKTDERKKPSNDVQVKQTLTPWRTAKNDTDLMRSIEPAVKEILYAPKDASFVSRRKYLHERYKENPENRYFYPYCSSWSYGWRLKDHPESTVSEFGAKSIIQSTFYQRKSSLQRDPDWYRMCQTMDPNNFNEILTY